MQYIYENFTYPPDQSFSIRNEEIEMRKYDKLNSHTNFEIALIENCSGKRFIGDHIEDFDGTQLVLLGSYLPHCWQYYKAVDPLMPPQLTVIHFFPDFLGNPLLEKPEAKRLTTLFDNAAKGVSFSGETVEIAKKLMHQMLHETGLSRAGLMLQLLDILVQSSSAKILSSPYFNSVCSSSEAQRINKVFDYIFRNFKDDLSLQDVAGIATMSASAFCRYFKQKTNRTLVDFIKEIRISHAARLLLIGNHNVTEACYDSGYNSLSNFYLHFKEIKGLSPRDFLKQYAIEEEINEPLHLRKPAIAS
jgi:AraC-like DNA-binding protein